MTKFNVNHHQLGYPGIFDLTYASNKCRINRLLQTNPMIIEVKRNGAVNLYYRKIFLNTFKPL